MRVRLLVAYGCRYEAVEYGDGHKDLLRYIFTPNQGHTWMCQCHSRHRKPSFKGKHIAGWVEQVVSACLAAQVAFAAGQNSSELLT